MMWEMEGQGRNDRREEEAKKLQANEKEKGEVRQ